MRWVGQRRAALGSFFWAAGAAFSCFKMGFERKADRFNVVFCGGCGFLDLRWGGEVGVDAGLAGCGVISWWEIENNRQHLGAICR